MIYYNDKIFKIIYSKFCTKLSSTK